MELKRGVFDPTHAASDPPVDPDSAKAGFTREPEIRNIKSQIKCAHCHHWVGWVTYHPRVQLAFGFKPVGGMVCRSCHSGLTMFPLLPDFEPKPKPKITPKLTMKLLRGVMPIEE